MATPIGNARDITLRALDVLRSADLIACEDTRVTAKLLAIYGIRATTLAYHDHNAEPSVRPQILQALRQGQVVALVSDAGTPLIADPGYRLVREVAEAGLPITALPGASAVLAALSLSGLPTDRFLFAGFLPERAAERRRVLGELATTQASLVFFESPRRLGDSLQDALQMLGDRPAAMGRELTKKFEEVRRGTLSELAAHYKDAEAPKGEVVLVIGPPLAEAARVDDAAIDAALKAALQSSSLQEWRCGIDHTSAMSVLRLLTPLPTANDVNVSWESVAGVSHFLERSTNLGASPPFLALATNLIGQTGTTTDTDTNAVAAPPAFYRVGVTTP